MRALVIAVAACTASSPPPAVAPAPAVTPPEAPVALAAWTREEAQDELARTLPAIETARRGMMQSRAVSIRRERRPGLEVLVEALATYPDASGLLIYHRTGDELRSWLLDDTGLVAWGRLRSPAAAITARIAELRAAIGASAGPQPAGASGPWHAEARALRDLVLAEPIRRVLPGAKHLVIQPIDDLGTIPFALLPLDRATTPTLLDVMTLSIAPELAAVAAQLPAWDGKFTSPLLVGAPRFGKHPDYDLPELPGTRAEVETLGKRLGATPLVDGDATETAVAARADLADLIVLSTHGISGGADALDHGFLALAADAAADGWWTAREIQHRKLQRARLVVLSACETGLGRRHDAGVIGLARAFQLAGAPRVIMSLWEIDDAETARFVDELIAEVARVPPAEATRTAALAARARGAPPRVWGALSLFGTPR